MPRTPELKAALIGAGFIGPVHVEALRRIGIEVRGIACASAARATQAAASLGLERAYRSVEELLDDPAISCVHVTSPNRYHAEHTLAALSAGKHVICEKPLAMHADESLAVAGAARARPHQVAAVAYNLRFYPHSLQARALCADGLLGQLFHAHGSYTQDWLLYRTDFNWRIASSEGGRLRTVGDIGTHWLDLITFITGCELEAVMGDLCTVHRTRVAPDRGSRQTFGPDGAEREGERVVPVDTEDYAGVLLRFRGGARGTLTLSQVTAGRKNCLRWELAGSAKAMAWNSEAPNSLWIGERGEANRELLRDPSLLRPEAARFTSYPGGHNEGFPDTFKQMFRAVYHDIANGGPSPSSPYATFADGHREMLVCGAIAQSIDDDRWVAVPDASHPGAPRHERSEPGTR